MVNVKIDPAFGDDHMEGEFDDDRFGQAEGNLHAAVISYVRAGARCDNLEQAIANALDEAGIA